MRPTEKRVPAMNLPQSKGFAIGVRALPAVADRLMYPEATRR